MLVQAQELALLVPVSADVGAVETPGDALATVPLPSLGEALPRGAITTPLDALAGVRVEAVVLRYTGGVAHLRAQLTLPTLRAASR